MAVQLLPLLLQAAPGIASGVANLFGRKRRKAQEDKASTGISQLADVFRGQLSGNYFDTPEASQAMTNITNNQNQNNRAINAIGATAGLTDEAKIAMLGKNNEATAGAMGSLAGSGQIWRDRTQQNYGNQLSQLFQVGQQNRGNFNQSLQNVLGPLQDGINTAVGSGAFDGMKLFGRRKPAKAS
jgi:hypothetical protein